MEEHVYALVMLLKQFTVFIGYSNIMAYVLHPTVKEILNQQDGLDIRVKWLSGFNQVVVKKEDRERPHLLLLWALTNTCM